MSCTARELARGVGLSIVSQDLVKLREEIANKEKKKVK